MRPLRLIAAVAAATFGPSLDAQSCTVAPSSIAGRLLTYHAAPQAFAVAQMPRAQRPWSLGLSLEVARIPEADAELRQPAECGFTRTDRTAFAPVLVRPRLFVGLPWRFLLEAGWAPPIPGFEVRPNTASFALSRVTPLFTAAGGEMSLVARGHATVASVRGAITCPESRLQQVSNIAPCYGTEPSNDRYRPEVAGAEGILMFDGALYGLWVGGGWSRLDPTFEVGFTDLDGTRDNTRVALDRRLSRPSFLLGGMYQVAKRVELAGQIQAVRDDLAFARASLTWRIP